MLVDDSIDDVFILSRLLQRAGVRNPLQIARDGDEAMRILSRVVKAQEDFVAPLAVFTDLNMPGTDGFGVLAFMAGHAPLDHVLRVVVTSSDLADDVRRAFRAGCHAYVRKHPSVEMCAAFYDAACALSRGEPLPVLPGLLPQTLRPTE